METHSQSARPCSWHRVLALALAGRALQPSSCSPHADPAGKLLQECGPARPLELSGRFQKPPPPLSLLPVPASCATGRQGCVCSQAPGSCVALPPPWKRLQTFSPPFSVGSGVRCLPRLALSCTVTDAKDKRRRTRNDLKRKSRAVGEDSGSPAGNAAGPGRGGQPHGREELATKTPWLRSRGGAWGLHGCPAAAPAPERPPGPARPRWQGGSCGSPCPGPGERELKMPEEPDPSTGLDGLQFVPGVGGCGLSFLPSPSSPRSRTKALRC